MCGVSLPYHPQFFLLYSGSPLKFGFYGLQSCYKF